MLTINQQRFLAERLLTSTDEDAAQKCEMTADSVRRWKRDCAEFVEAYQKLGSDGIELALDILRQHLGKMSITLTEAVEAMDGRKPDWQTRLAAIRIAFQSHGILRERRVIEGDADNPVKTIVEVIHADRNTGAPG